MNAGEKSRETAKAELLEIIGDLATSRDELAKVRLNKERKEIRRVYGEVRLVRIEAPIVRGVCLETVTDDKGNVKLKYSNEMMRKVEIETRLARDPEISKLTRMVSYNQKLRISRLKWHEATLRLKVQKLETLERLLLNILERE